MHLTLQQPHIPSASYAAAAAAGPNDDAHTIIAVV